MQQARLDTEPKPGLTSMTIWGIIVIIGGFILSEIGLDPTLLDFLADGFQVSDLMQLIGVILALVGRFQATRVVSGFFTTR